MTVTLDLEEHRGFLRALAYRMTGTVGDADDVVQEAFARTLAHPPPDLSRPLRPWLVRVTMNLARDLLRRRRRQGYVGPWLPGVVDDNALDAEVQGALAVESTEERYSRRESVTFAFLLALEALTPLQRAVLVLRDVFDFSGRETAEALGISEDNVKTTLSRAKKAVRAYDDVRVLEDRSARDGEALQRFVMALASDDVDGVLAVLREDVVGWSDGGGVFHAAKVPLHGREKVMTVYRNLTRQGGSDVDVAFVVVNGSPALLITARGVPPNGFAPRSLLRVDTDDDGRIRSLYSVLAPSKLVGLP
ncbi:MAG: sigma-70 family RNA polymerase sigma factor [Deltaproteobacteria bacterium]|nr:sigma-70 family RNA polymerase sigma factor [Deltaproteobacteria bacterium]